MGDSCNGGGAVISPCVGVHEAVEVEAGTEPQGGGRGRRASINRSFCIDDDLGTRQGSEAVLSEVIGGDGGRFSVALVIGE